MQIVDQHSMEWRAKLVLAGACLVTFFAAFEVRQPLVNFGFFNLTTSKLAAVLFFITVFIWGLGNARNLFSRRSLDLAVALFCLSDLISITAAADKVSALKFTLRMFYGAAIYFGVSRLPRRFRSDLAIAGTVTVAVLIVALVGLLQNFVIPVSWDFLLTSFQEEITTFGAFYNVRVASTLPYPTSLSMYLELTMPLALMFGLWLTGRSSTAGRRRWWLVASIAGVTAIMATQMFTFTRSGMVAAPVSLLIGAALAAIFGLGRRVWVMLGLSALIFAALLGGSALMSNKMAARMGIREQNNHYGAVYSVVDFPATLKPGQQNSARLQIRNTGSMTWGTRGEDDEVDVCYRWLDYPGGQEEQVPFTTTPLPHSVPTGGTVNIDVNFQAPAKPGQYIVDFDLVHLRNTWFSAAGVPGLQVPVQFSATSGQRFVSSAPASKFDMASPDQEFTSRSELWRAAIMIWRSHPVLGIGPDQFRLNYAPYIGVTPDGRIRTHDIFFEALANTGVVGLLAMLFLLGSALWVQLRLVREKRLETTSRGLAVALIVALMAYIGHGLLDYFLWETGVSFMFFILLGLTAWLDYRDVP
ncbi:MAG: O-antigen ligase family protein [Thermoleophilia bacterium]